MAHVLVIGASRGVGMLTVEALLAAGHTVRAFARSAEAIPLSDPHLEKRAGDALRQADVEAALDDIDAVIQVLGLTPGPAYFTGTTLFSRATRILVDAMKAAGVDRLIAITGIGAGNSRGHGGPLYDLLLFPVMLKRIYDDKDVQEQIIRASGLKWTILRPGILTDEPARSPARVLTDPRHWHAGKVSRAAVAAAIVSELADARHVGTTPLVIR